MSRSKRLTPLSDKAEKQLRHLRKRFGLIGRLRRRQQYANAVLRVRLKNARDFRLAQKLEHGLAKLKAENIVSFSPTHSFIDGDWKPFRVERGLTGAMRGEISQGSFTGTMTTSILDSSSVLFLENGDGQTLRVLIPSPATAVDMLARSLIIWRVYAGFDTGYDGDYNARNKDTHLSRTIKQFALADKWQRALTHPDVIDAIDASCQRPAGNRPTIRIRGTLVQKGVALATAIEVNDVVSVFVPTGFFAALTSTVAAAVPRAKESRFAA